MPNADSPQNSSFLLVCRVPGFEPARIYLKPGLTTVGRSKSCNFCLPDDTVSRQHAEIRVQGTSVSLRDLGSLNGTFLAGKQVQDDTVPLVRGQLIRFGTGSAKYRFVYAEEYDPSLDSDQETIRGQEKPPKTDPSYTSKVLENYKLTKAQREILDMLLEGDCEKTIAEKRYSAQQTIHTHIQNIYRIFNVHRRAELMALFMPPREADLNSDDFSA
ncbi:MAG: FHA domain-containing protein [Planctomycetes bacterium]|nr:FHA domain-containing protein [Planctomycetota bacterium]